MISLARSVRLVIAAGPVGDKSPNTYAGSPSMAGAGAFYEFSVRCAGTPDPVTGYLINIRRIDNSVRTNVAPLLAQALAAGPRARTGDVLREAINRLTDDLEAPVTDVSWRLTPTYALDMHATTMNTVRLRQSFEFAAAHRLCVKGWADAKNREVFGKCANPAGHGHNYRLEAAVDALLADTGAPAISLLEVERIVVETVIERFDHKHLNEDTQEFASLNPSVENIARVCYDLLKPAFQNAGEGVALRAVTVWETEKTCATYPAQ